VAQIGEPKRNWLLEGLLGLAAFAFGFLPDGIWAEGKYEIRGGCRLGSGAFPFQQKTQPFSWVPFFAARFCQGALALWFFLP